MRASFLADFAGSGFVLFARLSADRRFSCSNLTGTAGAFAEGFFAADLGARVPLGLSPWRTLIDHARALPSARVLLGLSP